MSLSTQALQQYRMQLEAELAALDTAGELGAERRKTVQLDQQSVGRLSRMDALQHQAMAKAEHARRAGSRTRILAALARMDDGEFGYCTECGEAIAEGRLDVDPGVPTCVSCASG